MSQANFLHKKYFIRGKEHIEAGALLTVFSAVINYQLIHHDKVTCDQL